MFFKRISNTYAENLIFMYNYIYKQYEQRKKNN